MTESEIYYAIPTNYTIGESFTTLGAALAEAATQSSERIRRSRSGKLFLTPNVTVDVRRKDETGDRVVRRYVVSEVSR